MDAAPGLPSPLTPCTDVPNPGRAPSRSSGKSVIHRNRLVNTQGQSGAFERQFVAAQRRSLWLETRSALQRR
ncbi:uncharacterized protein V6R79_023998 [Siganus canaliculatus]